LLVTSGAALSEVDGNVETNVLLQVLRRSATADHEHEKR
jgi:hypothetical protein